MPPATGRATARSWLIWSAAVTVYLLAVFHRTSFGVAGLQAAERFGVGAAALGTFTVLQVGVYAAMQIPTGVLVDRYGPRRVLTVAVLILGAYQILLGVAHSYGLGLLARGVLGLGDALTFVSVLRLVAAHFPGRQYALLTSFTAAVGYIGNLAATVPLSLVLDSAGLDAHLPRGRRADRALHPGRDAAGARRPGRMSRCRSAKPSARASSATRSPRRGGRRGHAWGSGCTSARCSRRTR